MTPFQIISLLISSGILGGVIAYAMRTATKVKAVSLGIQALLRAQMINDYNKWLERGFAPIYAKENFENCWKQYEALGANGVMSHIHDEFLALPTEERKDKR